MKVLLHSAHMSIERSSDPAPNRSEDSDENARTREAPDGRPAEPPAAPEGELPTTLRERFRHEIEEKAFQISDLLMDVPGDFPDRATLEVILSAFCRLVDFTGSRSARLRRADRQLNAALASIRIAIEEQEGVGE